MNQLFVKNKKINKHYLLLAINSVLLLPFFMPSTNSYADNNQSTQTTNQLTDDTLLLNTQQIQAQLNGLDNSSLTNFNAPIAYLNNDTTPVGTPTDINTETDIKLSTDILQQNSYSAIKLETQAIDNKQSETAQSEIAESKNIDNKNIQASPQQTTTTQPSILQKIYANLFNDGQVALPKVDTTIYIYNNQEENQPTDIIKANENEQPMKNIKAAIDNYTVDSIVDFNSALPRIKQTATDAAEAVGYYDVNMSFKQPETGKIDVLIESIGSPVVVDNRIFEIRGEGHNFDKYQILQNQLPLQEGDVFTHQAYSVNKAAVEDVSSDYGFFDGKWLNNSADIILPDNIADINLIYDTSQRYYFDDVVFVTRDPTTGKLTQDPNKLPVNINLLRQLVSFRVNQGYDKAKVTELSNDLFASKYFNNINVETVMPKAAVQQNADDVVNFEEGNSDAVVAGLQDTQTGEPIQISNDDIALLLQSEQETAALNFTIDDATIDKLLQVEEKVNRLSNMPDNQLLVQQNADTDNVIEKIDNSISDLVQQILPHDNTGMVNIQEPASSPQNNELIGKKTAEQTYESKKIPVYVLVESPDPRDAEIGIGWGTDTGAQLRAKMDHNLINKKGYQAGIEGRWSEIQQGITLYANRPWKHPLNDVLNANISYEKEVINQGSGNFDLNTKSVLAGISRNITNDSGWNRRYSLRYRLDDLETGIDSAEYEDLPVKFAATGDATQEALLLGYSLNKTVADDLTNPTIGWRQYYSLEGGAKGVVTDTNLLIARAGASGIYSFGDSLKHQLIGKVDTGYLWSENFEEVPYQLRFFAGGDQSIRGFDYNSLSPLENGYLTGGEILATTSAEYNYEVKDGLRAAVFADVGNAYDSDFSTDTKVGVGTGIRWLSPIGLIRLDVAAGVSEESVPIRLHFYIGSPL